MLGQFVTGCKDRHSLGLFTFTGSDGNQLMKTVRGSLRSYSSTHSLDSTGYL